eukprot:CAMPEP_0195510844 /NCGR_PEP_ID=MMETSP0794_2-20130614/3371_1 /TAXON_ID=515487 /ORGANISM="Stephanopyxis turris, Strain CCMP 815" /LENGTH=371 /DNA_ID=CAMNT_0040638347 /DNA_START=251 /DNA_END=1366 /DNA_ORIENTATION=+
MVDDLGLPKFLDVPRATWDAMFRKIESLMHQNPYHNFTHICDVSQAVYCILTQSRITEWLTPAETTYSFLSAICHDLDHPGNSNLLERNMGTALSKKFADSPLENHHRELACATGGILDEFGILSKVPVDTQNFIKSGMSEVILATDMAKHAVKTGALRTLLNRGKEALENAKSDSSIKCLFLQNLLKCADISNQGRAKPAADFWNSCIYTEFYAEGDRDRRDGRPVNPLHNRDCNDIAKSSVGFGSFVVRPLFELIHDFLKFAASVDPVIRTDIIDHAIALLKSNSESYKAEAEAKAAAKSEEAGAQEAGAQEAGAEEGDAEEANAEEADEEEPHSDGEATSAAPGSPDAAVTKLRRTSLGGQAVTDIEK